jgi:ketosteroid isomerase-like protein
MTTNMTTTREDQALALIEQFNEAWNAADLDAVIGFLTEDCVFENTSPAPDGERFVGQAAVRTAWEPVFGTPGMRFETEDIFACGDRVTTLWRYFWRNEDRSKGHIRGVDVFRTRDGRIAEKLSYVKG